MKIGQVARRLAGSQGWLAIGTLAAYAAAGIGLGKTALGATKTAAGEPGATDPAANLPVKRFDIPAGGLAEGIRSYEQATGLLVDVTLPGEMIAGFKTKGVSGLHTAEEGLRLLLDGTGLNYTVQDASTMVVGLSRNERVDVTSSLPDSVSMTKFTQPLIDTPQSVAVVPQYVLHDEGNTTLRDALRNVPGISIAAGESGAQGDNLTIRGFTARNDIFLDGIRDFGSYYRDSFNFEQVEVLEGPAGVQFGRGATGGVINQSSKVPAADSFVNGQAQFGTDATRRLTVDINEPVSKAVGGVAFRLNAVGVEGGVAGRRYANNRHYGVAPSITLGVNSPSRVTLSYFHFTETDIPDYGLPWFYNAVAPGEIRHNYYGFPNANYLRTSDDVVTAKVDHQVAEEVALHSIARWANYARQMQITEPQICSNVGVSTPVGGVVSALPTSAIHSKLPCPYTLASNPETIAVNRNQLQIKSVEGDLWGQTELAARFKVLGVRNDLVAGAEGGQEVSNPIRTSYSISSVNPVAATNLLRPNAGDAFGGTGYVTSVVHTKSDSAGVYFVDTVHFGHLFDLSGGVRWDYFNTGYNSYQPVAPPAGGTVSAPVGPLRRVDRQPSYRAAFVYKPNPHGSVYFDYGTSFNPAAESLSLSAPLSNKLLAPEQNASFEVGAKYSFMNERLMVDGAVFRTEKDNARETDPTNSNNMVNSGNQLVRGMQFSAVGRLPQGMDLVIGYAFLHSEVISSQLFPTSVGYPLANVPKQTVNFFMTHRLPLRLDGGLGGNYVGSRTASSTVPYVPTEYIKNLNGAGYVVTGVAIKQVPSYWVFNAMLRRPVTEQLELQANVYNLMNRFYIDQPHPSHLIPGAGLSALIGVNFKF